MKILHDVEHHTLNEGNTAVIDITSRQQTAVTFPLNLEAIAHKEITADEILVIPYRDSKIKDLISGLAYDVATNTDFIYPDYDNVKASIVIDMMSDNGFKPSLLIEVQPPKYSEEEKAGILATADKNTFGTDFSDYTIWQDIFQCAEAFHQKGGCTDYREASFYPIEFDGEELKSFMWFLVNHCHMVATGGSYR